MRPLYVAFSGDLLLNYTLPTHVVIPNAFIRLLAQTPKGPREITTLKVNLGRSSGLKRVKCGLIENAGIHILEMHMFLGGDILTTTQFTTIWPKFHLQLPDYHIAQTTSVLLKYVSPQAECTPVLHRYSFQIDLEYRKEMGAHPSFNTDTPKILHTLPVLNISNPKGNYSYGCDVFDVSGVYRTVLKSSYNSTEVIASSEIMDVKWSNNYPISIFKGTVFPCNGHLSVLYVHPQCTGTNDKIRMYALRRHVVASMAVPLEHHYVTERRADPDKTFAVFDCDLFSTTAIGYCFVYVSMSRDGEITEQNKTCMPAFEGTGNILIYVISFNVF